MVPSTELTKSQINRLGDRLRKGDPIETDRKLLDEYRRSFREAYETVVGHLRNRLKLEPTGRPAKTTTAIIEKLRREKTRLSQMQDIAGCRIVRASLLDQDNAVAQIQQIFKSSILIDRRYRPSHGYRAVHVVVEQFGKLVEVQVRTSLQHTWAEFSEKLSDEFGHEIKYGGGNREFANHLASLSDAIFDFEETVEARNYDSFMAVTNRAFGELQALINAIKEERAKQ